MRPIARRHLRTPPQMRTGTAALVGKTAMVTERIDADERRRQARGRGLDGAPVRRRDEVIEAGSRVHVVEIQGATALVSENV